MMSPQSKVLACGDIGVGAMAEVEAIANAVHQWLQDPSDIEAAEPDTSRRA
jgi:phosphopantothenoylcysteine synthetase/decarboxylase